LSLGLILKLTITASVASIETAVLIGFAIAGQTILGSLIGIYRYRWRISSFEEVTALGFTWLTVATGITIGNFLFRQTVSDLPSSAVINGSLGALSLMIAARVAWRRLCDIQRRPQAERCRRTIVVGAGEGGGQVIRAMLSDPNSLYYPVALIDDDPALENRQMDGVHVEGARNDIAEVAARHGAEVLLIAIPSATSKLIQELSALAVSANLEVRVLPATNELVGGMSVTDVRPPTVNDLLGRDPVEIDLESVVDYLRDRRVLITGAGGSIGSELSRQVQRFGPSKLFLLDRDESALHSLQLSMEGRALLDNDGLIVADIRDRDRMFEVFDNTRPDVVFHTAALKHLTLLENHPSEGVKTNTIGTSNLLDAALNFDVKRFVNISTDKAADPTSVLGATKLAAERLTAQAAKEVGEPYLSVRFGNVLGSRGSVLPIFLDQLENGNKLTVTDPDVTRYFMTIPEAVRLVVQAGAIGDPGEVLVLDMGEPVKILDLAKQLIDLVRPGTEIEFTGLRPGEKMHEVLIAKDEVGATRAHPRINHTAGEVTDPADALAILGEDVVSNTRSLLADAAHVADRHVKTSVT
jgi:FlaA1/EpsC-like NDP-sugar epimerase